MLFFINEPTQHGFASSTKTIFQFNRIPLRMLCIQLSIVGTCLAELFCFRQIINGINVIYELIDWMNIQINKS